MNYITVATILILACMTINARHHSEFIIHKSSFGSPCQAVECVKRDDKLMTCTARWTESCLTTTLTWNLGDKKDDIFPIVDRNGLQCDGRTMKLDTKGAVTKFAFKTKRSTIILCGSENKRLTDEDRKNLKELCPEIDLKHVDNSNC